MPFDPQKFSEYKESRPSGGFNSDAFAAYGKSIDTPKPKGQQQAESYPEAYDPTFEHPFFKAAGWLGKKTNDIVQNDVNYLAEKAGKYLPEGLATQADIPLTVLSKASEWLLPKTKEEAAMNAFTGIGEFPAVAADLKAMFSKGAGLKQLSPLAEAAPKLATSVAELGVPKLAALGEHVSTPQMTNPFQVPEAPRITPGVPYEISTAEPRVDPEIVAKAAISAREAGVNPKTVLTTAEYDLLKKTADRLILAKKLTGRAANGMTAEELATLEKAHPGIQPTVPQEGLPQAGKIESPPRPAAELPASTELKIKPAGYAKGPTELPQAEAPEIPSGKGPPPSKPGLFAQWIQGRAGRKISLGEAQYAVDNPAVLDRAKSIDEAVDAYGDAVLGLKGKIQSLRQRLNKASIGSGDYTNAIDRADRLYRGTPIPADKAISLTPQDALEGVQTINQAIRDKQFTMSLPPDQVSEYLKIKDNLMNYLQNNGAPRIRQAARDLFEAHVKENFSSWLPQNKFGSADALRTTWAAGQAGTAASLALMGHPISALPIVANAAMASPKVLGGIIKGAGAVKTAANGLAGEAIGKALPRLPFVLAQNMGTSENPDNRAIELLLGANTLNPSKSGSDKSAIEALGLSASESSNSGKNSLTQLTHKMFAAGLIKEDDEGEALKRLKSYASRSNK